MQFELTIGEPLVISPVELVGQIHRSRRPATIPKHTIEMSAALSKISTVTKIFLSDSITEITRLSYRHAEQQPEAFSERSGKKDIRGAYGLHARQMIQWLQQLQHARAKNVIFVAVLEKVTDEFNRFEWRVQLEGSKTGRELPAIVDQVITMQWVDFGGGKLTRAFICTANPWGYPAKDRSGRLEQIEEPNLGKLIAKLVPVTDNPVKAVQQ